MMRLVCIKADTVSFYVLERKGRFMLIEILLIVVGFILLIKGADYLVDGASNIAKKFHIPEIIIGLTIVSIGTSMPELFVSLTSALEGYSDMAIGNVIGSNVCNLLLILGLSSVIKTIKFQENTKKYEIPMCFIVSIIFLFLCNIGTGISRIDALLLLVLFIGFISYTIYMGLKEQKKETKKEKQEVVNINMFKNILYVVGGIAALKFGGDFVVDNAVSIANRFNLSEKLISLTILAVGTSLPELVTSITAAYKGNSDIAIGNIIGSNIFNMLLIIGASALIKPIVYNLSYNLDMVILLIGTVLLMVFPKFSKTKNEMRRNNGFSYLGLYAAYLIILFLI